MSLTRQSILFINGLAKSVNENMLYQLFNDYSVSYIKIAKDHQTKESYGYAFIGFKNRQKAEEALKNLNYSKLAKKTLRISWYDREPNNYRNHPEYNIFIKRIPKEVSTKEFAEYFGKYGKIVSCKIAEDEDGEPMGYGFVLYNTEEGAKTAIKECNGKEFHGKKLFVAQFQKNRPKQEIKFNNIYVRNIPKNWSEDDVKNYFSKYGEIGSMLVKAPEEDKLNKNLPEEKKINILEHKYAFVCFKSLDGPAKKAVAKVPYLKLNDENYNKKIEKISEIAKNENVKEVDIFKCACHIIDNGLEEKISNENELKNIIEEFQKNLDENDGFYLIKDKSDRLDCFQALKKKEREKKLKNIYEKIKKKIKEKYRFCNLYVKNLPDNFTNENLRELFGKYGEIRSSKIVKKELLLNYITSTKIIKTFGFVCFYEQDKAHDAKQELKNKSILINGPKLYVEYFQTKTERLEFLKLKFIKHSEKNKNIKNMPSIMPSLMSIRPYSRPPLSVVPPINNMRQPYGILRIPPVQGKSMERNARSEYYGEKLFDKISGNALFNSYRSLFPKIIGVFLDLEDSVLERLLRDDKYFMQQVSETVKLLTEKEKSSSSSN